MSDILGVDFEQHEQEDLVRFEFMEDDALKRAGAWVVGWNVMSREEKYAYLAAHPRSRESDDAAYAHALQDLQAEARVRAGVTGSIATSSFSPQLESSS